MQTEVFNKAEFQNLKDLPADTPVIFGGKYMTTVGELFPSQPTPTEEQPTQPQANNFFPDGIVFTQRGIPVLLRTNNADEGPYNFWLPSSFGTHLEGDQPVKNDVVIAQQFPTVVSEEPVPANVRPDGVIFPIFNPSNGNVQLALSWEGTVFGIQLQPLT